MTINLTLGKSGIINRGDEVGFKTKMQQISEELSLYNAGLLAQGQSTNYYAGSTFKNIIKAEELDIEESEVKDIKAILSNVGTKEEVYVIVYEGNLYYVSQEKVLYNENYVKWCNDLGIPVWELEDLTGIKVVNGNYELVNGIYVCTPKLNDGFVKANTRYMKLDTNGNLVAGNWINKKPDNDWYDYKKGNWANIYVENNGRESYFVWVPRYAYKLDSTSQRSDVKFIDCNNNYIDAVSGEIITWETLQTQGYKIPEAFWWDKNGNETEDEGENIEGYWMSKYQLSDLGTYTINFDVVATPTTLTIQNITTNTTKTIAKYVYAINGIKMHESTSSETFKATNLAKGTKAVNVTALDANNEIVGSMTRVYEVAKVNEPDVSNFDKDTTFYVYWDEEGNEHNEIPISMPAPAEWYDYTSATWANIVTRNNGRESYFVWIPRYSYMLDSISQRTYVKFLKGTETQTDSGYKIPEAFWWDNNGNGVEDEGEALTGYWMSKYQLSTETTTPRMDATISAGITNIHVKGITGSLIDTANTNGINVKYEYYINGEKKYEGSSNSERYEYSGLNENTTYTINIIARNLDTNEYIGAVTKKITTVTPYEPDISAFNPETTYYVIYDGDNETRVSIKDAKPDNWYDYANEKWANIVTTTGETESYFVWIPRYEYMKDGNNQTVGNERMKVNFITTDINNNNCSPGYKVPEAFWWDNNGNGIEDEGETLTGFWMSKYQLSN